MENAAPPQPLYQEGDVINLQDGTNWRVKKVRHFGLLYYLMPADEETRRRELSLGFDASPDFILNNRI